jgi:3-phosphoshikimate 1-carboxyvinyltransferase
MNLIVNQCKVLSGSILSPSSKSHTIRGMLLALLAKGESTLFKPLSSDDTQVAMNVCRVLGAKINVKGDQFIIQSKGLALRSSAAEIKTGNSGITTRFILPLLGLRENYATPILLSCDTQMQARPIKPLVDALNNLGMNIQYTNQAEHLPLLVSGQLKGGMTEIEGISSQYLSALLIGLPCAENSSVITVKNLNERPYVDMTLAWLQQQGINYTHQRTANIDTFHIPGKQEYKPVHTRISGDFSSASYLIAAAVLIPGEVEIRGLDSQDIQGDKRLLSLLQKMGAKLAINQKSIKIKGNKPLRGICIDANDIPDLLPTLAVIATQATGKTKLYNVIQARIKETDRIHSITSGLRQMGAKIEENSDGIIVHQSNLKGSLVQGFGDHRTVMALTVAGMIARGTTLITDAIAINKTYPDFVSSMQAIGAKLSLKKKVTDNPIILIGFKHVGKTTIGRHLARVLNKSFIDLDREVEILHKKYYLEAFSCREIMQSHGELHYRQLESEALQRALKLPVSVISLGGGTTISQSNQALLKPHRLLHVVASRGIVFERIMVEGRPSFFDPNEDSYTSFSRLWDERYETYRKLTHCTINNNDSIEQAVNEALIHLHMNPE